ncbi:hypothetical protein L0F63_001277 [Massospora cicadina]|nr:hypothetical protein L0F63_001277 [Massospora cicadina]
MDIIAPFTSYDIPDTVTLSEFDNPLMVDSSLEGAQSSGDHSSDNMLGTISGVTTPEKKSNLRKMDKPTSSKNRVAEPSVKESCAKKKSLLVTLAIPEIARSPTRIREQSDGESSKKVSHEPASPIRASKHAASKSLAKSPKRLKSTVSKGTSARDSENIEASCQSARTNAIPGYNHEAYLQSQCPLNARVCELPSRKETTQKSQHKSQQVSEFIKQEIPPATQFQEVKHHELPQESNSLKNLALKTKSIHSHPQEQRDPPVFKLALRKLDLFVSLLAPNFLLKENRANLNFTPLSPHPLQIFVLVPLEDLPKPVQLLRRSRHQPFHARAFLISRIAHALLSFPLSTLSNLCHYRLCQHFLGGKYLLNARDTYRIGKNRLNQKNPLAIATLVDSLMWYCNGFHYHKLSGVSTTEETIEQWSTLFGLIDTCVANFEAVADGAAVFGVLHYAKSMVCSRIAGLMAQLLVGTVDSSLAQHHCVMLKQANQAFSIATSVLDTSYVRRAFPELWKHFESKGFAGYPPLRPPIDDSANLTYFGRYILYTYLQMKDMEEPTCLEDDMTCIGLPFLDPYI